jgi:hypothetical protein
MVVSLRVKLDGNRMKTILRRLKWRMLLLQICKVRVIYFNYVSCINVVYDLDYSLGAWIQFDSQSACLFPMKIPAWLSGILHF